MKKLSYHEVLEYYYNNINNAIGNNSKIYILYYYFEDGSYSMITYDYEVSVFRCSYINSRGLIEGGEIMYAVFGKHKDYKNEYFLFPANYNPYNPFSRNKPMLPLPESPDEWFNFALVYQYTEEDFKLFKKIVQHHENKSST